MKKRTVIVLLMIFAAQMLCAEMMDRILVKINDALILESEVAEMAGVLGEQAKLAGKTVNMKKIRKEVLNNLVEQKLIISMATEEQIAVSEEAIADKVNEFINALRERFPDEESFETALLKEGISYADFRIKIEAQVRDNLVFTRVKQKKQSEFISKAAVSDDEIKKYYNRNKNDFKVNDEVEIYQVYIEKDKTADPVKHVREVVDRINKGESFEKVAADLIGKEGISGGDLGWVDTTQMDRAIRNALSKPKKGKLVGPVETDEGYHLFKVMDYKAGKIKKLSEIKERVRVKVIENKVERMWGEWIEKIKGEAYIKYM